MLFEHLMYEVERTVSSSLRTQDGTSPFHALTGEHTLELMGQFLVLSEEVTDFTGTNADVTCRNILIRADMAV